MRSIFAPALILNGISEEVTLDLCAYAQQCHPPRMKLHPSEPASSKCRGRDWTSGAPGQWDRVAEPPEDIDIVPTFFVVPTGRVIVNAYLVAHIAVQLGIKLRLENVL